MEHHKYPMTCNRTYSHIAVAESGNVATPCCQFSNYRKTQVVELAKIDSFNQVLESPQWADIRDKIETGQANAHCSNCFSLEDQGLESLRTHYNSRSPLNGTLALQDIEIALDFTCNMMCRICKPAQSSKWAQANGLVGQLNQFDPMHYSMPNAGKPYSNNIKRLIQNSNFSKLKRIRLVGGEPLYSRLFVEFLERVDADVGLENIDLSMNTNGSIIPEADKAKLLRKCKSLQIQLSIDAIGELANVIRPGIPWQQIQENVPQWVSFVGAENTIQIHATFSIMNVNQMQSLVDFATSNGAVFSGHKLFNPAYLRMDQIPRSASWRISNEYSWYDQFNGMLETPLVESQLDRFVQAMLLMDSHHGKSFAQVNPEIWQLVHEQLR